MKDQKIRYISLAITFVIVVVLVSIFLIFNSRNNNKKNTSSGKKKTTDNEEIEEITDKYKKDELAKLVEIVFENVNDFNLGLYLKQIRNRDKMEITDATGLVLPDCFDVLPKLTDLKITNSSLKSLPKSFGKMKNMKTLDLSGNNLDESSLNPIFEIVSLEDLNMSSNELTTIPSEIRNLINLKKLYLGKNKLNELSLKNVFEIRSLKILDISYNELTNIPSEIMNLINLKDLTLNDNNFNKDKAEEALRNIFQIGSSLEVLNVMSLIDKSILGNKFRRMNMPDNLPNLTNLKELYIGYNLFNDKSVEDICKLGKPIVTLDLSNMDIAILPKNLSNLENLIKLNLSRNKNLQVNNEEFKGIYKLKNLERLGIEGCESLKPWIKEVKKKIEETFGNDFDLIE